MCYKKDQCSLFSNIQNTLPRILQLMNYNEIAAKTRLTKFPAKKAALQEFINKGGYEQYYVYIRFRPFGCVQTCLRFSIVVEKT